MAVLTRSACRFSTLPGEKSTIYALSSGKGKSGVAVLRISGPGTSDVLMQLTKKILPPPRLASLRTIYHPTTTEILDRGIVLWFPGPHSFTGEDVAELHVHGGLAVVRSTLDALGSFARTREAQPGEFTKRSFFNGKMDLTEAEGVADLIHAETEAQRRQAYRQMAGSLSRKYAEWRERLLRARAFLEAFIDFGEDEQLDPGVMDEVKTSVQSLHEELKAYLNDHRRGERLRNGVQITIVGEPNVGKSSLLNALCLRPAAIVSPIAGTTRDIVESAFDLGGYPVVFSDTAGLRSTDDLIENEGIRRATARAQTSDLILLVVDSSNLPELPALIDSSPQRPHQSLISQRLSEFGMQISSDQKVHLLFNKIDLLPPDALNSLREKFPSDCHFVSCTEDQGMTEFVTGLTDVVKDLCGGASVGEANLTQQRHRQHLQQCSARLDHFWTLLAGEDVVLATHEIQQALRCIGRITGHVYVEEVLEVIFRDFCIGK
ncbi:tRNA modification GTPase GTPBP3, mitochondrial [Hypsibius exemplaris]|uniref:tRNA modification GTPase GTPBP3, mitochondrial n=1 Tax=Hypsibius exemplaris TaxID=2072580 RepID=A0A9X6RLN2_HYPEX|nr:tRNA modification GTPase GTPBP3, mitochondrial [Hypsibius exemplaris]